MTTIIHVNDPRATGPEVVYIGRASGRAANSIAWAASPWANPFRIGQPHPITGEPMDRDVVIELFDALCGDYAAVTLASLTHLPALHRAAEQVSDHVRRNAGDLVDTTVACWCAAPGETLSWEHDVWVCHGQPLAAAASRAFR